MNFEGAGKWRFHATPLKSKPNKVPYKLGLIVIESGQNKQTPAKLIQQVLFSSNVFWEIYILKVDTSLAHKT